MDDPITNDLRTNLNISDSLMATNDLFVKDSSSGKLNYVRVLKTSWNMKHLFADKFQDQITDWYSLSILLQAYATIGDYETVLNLTPRSDGHSDIRKTTNVRYNDYPAEEKIIKEFENHQVLMFNEAHDRIQCRSFLLGMLEKLKRAGAVNLALEAYVSKNNYDSTFNDGFLAEPIMGQIVRKAKSLGFKLISYEDTLQNHTPGQREFWQASNLFNAIREGDIPGKTVVLAGYSHISEDTIKEFQSMAKYFFQISHSNPLTVDQLSLIEKSTNPLVRQSVDSTHLAKISKPLAIPKKNFDLLMDSLVGHFFGTIADIYLYHPSTVYVEKRPDWALGREKQITFIPLTNGVKPVLIQAYLSSEIKTRQDFDYKVPYDQTSIVIDGKVPLVLSTSDRYKIVFRGVSNEIILIQDL